MAPESTAGTPFYCPLAWVGLAYRNDGSYRLCCYANVTEGRGLLPDADGRALNIRRDAADEVRNHDLLKKTRADFLRGTWPSSCARCEREETAGLPSGRRHALERLDSPELRADIVGATAADGAIDPAALAVRDIDIRFGNKCNLACRSCGPSDSSGWYGDSLKLGVRTVKDPAGAIEIRVDGQGRARVEGSRFDWIEQTPLFERLPKDLSKLHRIYIVGGEPLLVKAHRDLLEELVRRGVAGSIKLEYNTNLTVLPEAILSLWESFKDVGVGVSADGFGAFHEYLRYPGKASVLEKNLARLDRTPANVRAWLACTVSVPNAAHVVDFLFWKHRQDFRKIGNPKRKPFFSLHCVHQPEHLSLRNLPEGAKNWIETEILRRFEAGLAETPLSEFAQTHARDLLGGVIRFMRGGSARKPWPVLWNESLALDRVRGQTLRDLEPGLFAILQSEADRGRELPA